MPEPVGPRGNQLYTPTEPDADSTCKKEPPSPGGTGEAAVCTADPVSREPSQVCPMGGSVAKARSTPDYLTLSVGAGAIIGADVSVTLDRHGHLYLGAGAGVGVSATVVSASLQGGHFVQPTSPPDADEMKKILEGDSVQLTASFGVQVGLASAPKGTAAEIGAGLAQVSAEFQRNWFVLDTPAKW